MDRFVVRTPRTETKAPLSNIQNKETKQSTLHSLAGVVVVEDIERSNCILKSEEETDQKKINVLKRLKNKLPAKEVIVKVGIGKTIRKLSKDSTANTEVRELALEVYENWKQHLERKVELSHNKPVVQSDKETSRLRSASLKFLTSALQGSNSQLFPKHRKLAERLEKEILRCSRGLVNAPYRQLSRKVIFAIKHKEGLKESVLGGEIEIGQLVARYQ